MAPVIDLRGAPFDRFLAYVFEHDGAEWQVKESAAALRVDPALQLAYAERLFRDPAAVAGYTAAQREQGFWFLPGWFQPDFFSGQIWNHDLPLGARISCVSAMEVLFRDLFAKDPHGKDAFMWFDLLEDGAPADRGACPQCEPVRRTIIGVLDALLALPQEHCQLAALHGLNHWGTDAERARLVDAWLQRTPSAQLDADVPGQKITARGYALQCRAGRAQ